MKKILPIIAALFFLFMFSAIAEDKEVFVSGDYAYTFLNENGDAYEHCELSVDGEGFLALAEAKHPCDVETVHKYKWETMTFNVFEMGSKEKVDRALSVLSKGGVVIEPVHALAWNAYCATVMDQFGVCWWIAI